jgi:C-terminal processing protease CtpA/Prc
MPKGKLIQFIPGQDLPGWKWRKALAVLVFCAVVTACGDGGNRFAPSKETRGTNDPTKNWVQSTVREWYLFLDLLPPPIDPGSYATPDLLLDALTAGARAQGKDRFFSYLTTVQEEQQFFDSGTAVGFGFGLSIDSRQRLFVSQVYAGSAAADAGFLRGDEILSIGATETQLQAVAILIASNTFYTTLSSSVAGTVRVFEVRTRAGSRVFRTAVTRQFSLDPVPEYLLLPRPGLTPIGYLNFRSFIGPAQARLEAAFHAFKAEHVTDVVIDLRYNGGGLLSVAEQLANLLSSDRDGQVMYGQTFNANPVPSARNVTRSFAFADNAVNGVRIAFITTGGSASASELVINALQPYAEVAIIGSPTYGKPVGSLRFELLGSGTILRLVAFRMVNRDGHGDYFTGLPDATYAGCYCPASDDLGYAQGDPSESSTHTALYWLNQNACPPPVERPRAAPELLPVMPTPPRPGVAQIHQPGMF